MIFVHFCTKFKVVIYESMDLKVAVCYKSYCVKDHKNHGNRKDGKSVMPMSSLCFRLCHSEFNDLFGNYLTASPMWNILGILIFCRHKSLCNFDYKISQIYCKKLCFLHNMEKVCNLSDSFMKIT